MIFGLQVHVKVFTGVAWSGGVYRPETGHEVRIGGAWSGFSRVAAFGSSHAAQARGWESVQKKIFLCLFEAPEGRLNGRGMEDSVAPAGLKKTKRRNYYRGHDYHGLAPRGYYQTPLRG
jgi:hypothetical protein